MKKLDFERKTKNLSGSRDVCLAMSSQNFPEQKEFQKNAQVFLGLQTSNQSDQVLGILSYT